MSKRACIALICLVLATAACARPQYEEEPHPYEEYKGGNEHREHEQEYEPKDEHYREEPNYYPREDYSAYDSNEHYASLTLQEVKVQDFQWDEPDNFDNYDYSVKALFTCGEEKENAKECREASRHRRHGDEEFLQTTIMPDYVATCTIHVQYLDYEEQPLFAAAWLARALICPAPFFTPPRSVAALWSQALASTLLAALTPSVPFSPSYIGNGISDPPGRRTMGKKAVGKKRTLLAGNSPAYLHPHNETVYSGTAIAAHAHVTASSSGYNYELNHELKHAKVVYVGAFLGGVPVSSPEEGGYQDEGSYKTQLPFVTGGLLKLIVKK